MHAHFITRLHMFIPRSPPHPCAFTPRARARALQIDAGKWFVAATSVNVVLKQCIGLPVPLWREVLSLMGGKYGIISRLAYGDL
jgi:hypothetical protein